MPHSQEEGGSPCLFAWAVLFVGTDGIICLHRWAFFLEECCLFIFGAFLGDMAYLTYISYPMNVHPGGYHDVNKQLPPGEHSESNLQVQTFFVRNYLDSLLRCVCRDLF